MKNRTGRATSAEAIPVVVSKTTPISGRRQASHLWFFYEAFATSRCGLSGTAQIRSSPGTSSERLSFLSAENGESILPAKSAAQQKAAGAALSAKRGETPKSKLKGASISMVESMSETELKKMASTKRKGKPEHKTQDG